jgi:hypothetical protein
MATPLEGLLDEVEFYYHGLWNHPKLLARSSRESWTRPPPLDYMQEGGAEGGDTKAIFPVTHHALQEKLRQGLRGKILYILSTMQPCSWICVNYARIGYDKEIARNNLVVVLITVEKDQVPAIEAQRVVYAISEECRV